MIAATEYPFSLTQGEAFNKQFRWTVDGAIPNFIGATANMQLRRKRTGPVVFELSSENRRIVLDSIPRKSWNSWGVLGARFFSTFPLNGSGTIAATSTSDFWKGAMNRTSIEIPLRVPTNFTLSFFVPESKTYFFGVGADDFPQVSLDGVVILNGALNTFNPQVFYQYWNVYPLTLSRGDHTISATGVNNSGVGGMGVEIYNNSIEELKNATSNTIFTSSGGGVSINLTSSETTSIPEGNYVYDLEISKDDVVRKFIKGTIVVMEASV